MIPVDDFKQPLRTLLAETFGVADTPTGFFLDSGRSGLLGTIDGITASQASLTPGAGHATVAAHCGHVLYQLRIFEAFEQGRHPAMDWPSSWNVDTVDEVAWTALRGHLRATYESVAGSITKRDTWPPQGVGAALMLLAHCAYHLGEVRQILSASQS
jgi:hypothetical protein